jgi:hypothetical protein
VQQHYIDDLLHGLRWTRETPYFLTIVKRATGRSAIRTKKEASALIGILRKLLERYLNAPRGVSDGGESAPRGA